MALGKQLDDEDSRMIREILADPKGVRSMTFYPRDEGYGEITYRHDTADGEPATSATVRASDPRFDKVMEVVEAHDYPGEFNGDKFFVELTDALEHVPSQGEDGSYMIAEGRGWQARALGDAAAQEARSLPVGSPERAYAEGVHDLLRLLNGDVTEPSPALRRIWDRFSDSL